MTAIIWTWTYGRMYASTVSDADWPKRWLDLAEDDGCAVQGVEVDGEWLDYDAAERHPLVEAEERRRDAEAEREWAIASRKRWTTVYLRHPVNVQDWGQYGRYDDPAAADEAATQLRGIVGWTRVRISR